MKNENKVKKKKDGMSAKFQVPPSFCLNLGHPVSTSKEGHLILTNVHSNYWKKKSEIFLEKFENKLWYDIIWYFISEILTKSVQLTWLMKK